jgi:hypothetical protein
VNPPALDNGDARWLNDRVTSASAGFRVPVARDARGRLVTPEEASRGGVHACPACEGVVDLHAGGKKRRHFHHRATTCSAETALHAAAKLLVARAVEGWLSGGPPVVFDRCCAARGCAARTRQPIPRKVARVELEHRLASGHVVDVALLASGVALPVAAVEIVVTHEVDEEKTREMGVPWIECDAAQVCDAHGRVVVAVRDEFLPWLCAAHAGQRGRGPRAARHERRARAAIVASLGFDLRAFPEYRAERVTRCARGHDALVFSWYGAEPPWPRPPLVVATAGDLDWRRTSMGGWARVLPWRRMYRSACGVCGEILEA